jgi:hypothetical protein
VSVVVESSPVEDESITVVKLVEFFEDLDDFELELETVVFLLLGKLEKLGILLGVSSSESELSITAADFLNFFVGWIKSSSLPSSETDSASLDDDRARLTLRKFPEKRAISACRLVVLGISLKKYEQLIEDTIFFEDSIIYINTAFDSCFRDNLTELFLR